MSDRTDSEAGNSGDLSHPRISGGRRLSYGANLVDAYYQMGVQVGRVLKGANITDVPIVRSTKFELALNLKTAKALGLTIPPTLLAIVDEVID